MSKRIPAIAITIVLGLGGTLALLGVLRPVEYYPTLDAQAAPAITHTLVISEVVPSSSLNDINTPLQINGAGFQAVFSGTEVISAPVAHLDATQLVDLTFVNSQTLDTVVPWGLETGIYDLTVVNPDGISVTLANAFTLTQGLNLFISNGPYGGQMMDIYLKPSDPQMVLATAFGAGLFMSEDGGGSWQIVQDHDWPIHLSFDSANPDVIYHGADSNDYYRSLDGGYSWTHMPQIFHTQNGCSRYYPAAHPSLGGSVYMGGGGCGNIPLESGEGGVFYSSNYGDSWTAINTGLTDLDVQAVDVNPQNPAYLIAGTYYGNVFASSNGGASWEFVLNVGHPVAKIWFNPHQALEAWVSAKGEKGYALYRGRNLTNWDLINIDPGSSRGGSPWNLFFETGKIWAASGGVWYSENGGDTWTQIDNLHHGGNAVTVQSGNPQTIYIGDDLGVMKTTNGGLDWFESYDGLAGLVPEALAAAYDPLTVTDWVYVKTGQTIFKSIDGGNSWLSLDHGQGGFPDGDFMAIDPFDPQRLFVGSIITCVDQFCLDFSPDGGVNWYTATAPLPSEYSGYQCGVYAVTPHPTKEGLMLAGTSIYPEDSSPWEEDAQGGIFRSDDSGLTWTYAGPDQTIGRVTEIRFDAFDPDLVYVSTQGSGLWRSDDGGDTWEPVALPGMQPPVHISAIEVHPDVAGKVYVRAYSFATSPNPEPEMFKSADGGLTWEPMNSLFLARDLAITPHVPGAKRYSLYSGCDEGLCRSMDDGLTWQAIAGTPRPEILKVAGDGERTILYLGTPGGLMATGEAPLRLNGALGVTAETLVGGGVYRLTSAVLDNQIYLPVMLRMGD